MYGDVVMELKPQTKDDLDPFEVILDAKKKSRGVELDVDLTAEDLKELVKEYKAAIKDKLGLDFPEDPKEQLWGAIGAVFGSWQNNRANIYRKLNNIPDWWELQLIFNLWYSAISVRIPVQVSHLQEMQLPDENYFYGEFLMNAQGEDVVAVLEHRY